MRFIKILSIYLLLCTVLCGKAYASVNCEQLPDCAALGFSTADDETCASDGYLYCPFDSSYKKCVKHNQIDCSAYALSTCPEGANCSACGIGTTITYKVDSCEEGYTLADGTCTPSDCSDYTLSSCPTDGVCETCQSGSELTYKLTGCEEGSVLLNENSCYNCAAMYDKYKQIFENKVFVLGCEGPYCEGSHYSTCTNGGDGYYAWNDSCICDLLDSDYRDYCVPGDLIVGNTGSCDRIFYQNCSTVQNIIKRKIATELISVCPKEYWFSNIDFKCDRYIKENSYNTTMCSGYQ